MLSDRERMVISFGITGFGTTIRDTRPGDMAGWGWQSAYDPAVLPFVMER